MPGTEPTTPSTVESVAALFAAAILRLRSRPSVELENTAESTANPLDVPSDSRLSVTPVNGPESLNP